MTHKEFQSQSLQQQAYNYLYEQIVSGRIPPGYRVVEQTISKEIGISRSPIREAIRRLASEGLVTVHPQGGVSVYKATNEDFKHLFECRLSVEPTASYYAAIRITDIQRFQFDQLVEEMNIALNNTEKIKGYTKKFHQMIVEMSANPYLMKMSNQLYSLTSFYRNALLNIPQRIEKGHEEHIMIWKAIREQDPIRAESLMKAHLLLDYEYYTSELERIED